MQLVQLQNDMKVIHQAGFGLAAISYDSPAVLSEFARRKSITFPLLSDHDSKEIRAYGVANRQYRKGMQLDVNTERVYTNTLGFVPVFGLADPAVFVLTRDHQVKWRFVSEGSELRLTGSAILEESVSAIADEIRTPVPSRNVVVSALATNTSAGLGNRILVSVELKIPKGFHVYSRDAGGDYIGVDWRMDPTPCLDFGEPSYPKPETKLMKSTGENLPVYEDTLRISRELVVKPGIQATDPSAFKRFCALCVDRASDLKASSVLRFQACDETRCYPPQTVRPQWTLHFIYPDLLRSPGNLRRELEP